MSERTTTAGSFTWNELATRDLGAAEGFYSKLFGWTLEEAPMPDEHPGKYGLWRLDGVEIGGAYQMEGEMFAGVPPNWGAYVAVDDVDAALARVAAAGGAGTWPATDVPGVGRMGGFADPTGAMLAVLHLTERDERPDLGPRHGFFCWNELNTSDTEKARSFYAEVFGWTARQDDGPMPYTEFQVGGQSVAGMIAIDPGWGPVPSHWAVYVSVPDCDASVAKALELGAEVRMPALDVPEVGRFAHLADPTGAGFSVITLTAKHFDR